jgi:hypothetical protein
MRKITTQRGVELSVPEKGERHPGAGRPKGSKNQITAVLKEAILLAAAESQHAKDNGGGLVGYFTYIANERVDLMVRLLIRVMVLQEKELAKTKKELARPVVYQTVEEVRAALIARGVSADLIDGLLVTRLRVPRSKMSLNEKSTSEDIEVFDS